MSILKPIKIILVILLLSAGITEASDDFRIEPRKEPYIGCEVTLSLTGKVTQTPRVVFEWTFEGNAKPIRLQNGGAECSFTPIDTEPMNFTVNAVGPDGKVLDSAELTLSAKEFAVNISMLEQPVIKLWDTNTKQEVPAEGLIAGNPIRLEAILEPEYKNDIRCQWTTDASTGIVEGESSPQVTVIRNEIGEAEISVIVSDINGVVLGRNSINIVVPIPKSALEESARRKAAWEFWTEATALWEAHNYDEALQNARKAAETDPETSEIADGLKTMAANHARVERARKLFTEAESLKSQQKLTEALKTYRRSYAIWQMSSTQAAMSTTETEIDKIRQRNQAAEWLKDTAAAYDQEGFFEDALAYYKKTLELVPDAAVEQRAARIQARLTSIAKSKELKETARKQEVEGRLQEALDTYKASLNLESNSELLSHAKELEETIKERKNRAATLRREAADLEKKKKNSEALVRYKESQALWPESDLAKRIATLEKTVTLSPKEEVRTPEDFGIGTHADATRWMKEGHALYKQGQYKDALQAYRKSYAISKDKRLGEWIDRVEKSLQEYEAVIQANALIKAGNSLYKDGNYKEALKKYRESLAIHPNTEVENFTRHIESEKLGSADVAP